MTELLNRCSVSDRRRVEQIADKWKEDTTITAEMALAEIEVGTHSLPTCCIDV